jgi:copper chaperone CopZ
MKVSNLLSFVIAISCIILAVGPACKKQTKQPTFKILTSKEYGKDHISRADQEKEYTLKVEGVECELCSQSVTELLSSLPGLSHVRYELNNGEYEQGQVKFLAQRNAVIDEPTIAQQLHTLGFELTSLVSG